MEDRKRTQSQTNLPRGMDFPALSKNPFLKIPPKANSKLVTPRMDPLKNPLHLDAHLKKPTIDIKRLKFFNKEDVSKLKQQLDILTDSLAEKNNCSERHSNVQEKGSPGMEASVRSGQKAGGAFGTNYSMHYSNNSNHNLSLSKKLKVIDGKRFLTTTLAMNSATSFMQDL